MRRFSLIFLISTLAACGGGGTECQDNYTYETPEIINCAPGDDTNPFAGCWRSEACTHTQKNFIYNECATLRTQVYEDYWFVPVISLTTEPQVIDGISMYGQISRNWLYFDNDQCSGEPVHTISFYRDWNPGYYTSGDEYITSQGLVANIFLYTNGITYADTGESFILSDISYFTSPDRMCMGDSDSPLELVNDEYTVPTALKLDRCGLRVTDRTHFLGTGVNN